jgi:hypothetical protein
MRSIAAVALATVAMNSAVYAQGETVVEAVARGATSRYRTAPSGRSPALVDVLRDTDLVVRGTIGDAVPRLSDDQRDVYTDYQIKNPVIFYQKDLEGSPRPGAALPITASQLGGELTIGDVIFTQTELGLPPLEPGSEALLLLQRVENRYYISRTFYGAFRIIGGKLTRLMTMEFAPALEGAPADLAAAAITVITREQHGGAQ